jgi:hypothetical protein
MAEAAGKGEGIGHLGDFRYLNTVQITEGRRDWITRTGRKDPITTAIYGGPSLMQPSGC